MNKLQELELEEIEDIMQEDIMQELEDIEKLTDNKYKIQDLDGAVRTFKRLNAINEKIKDIERIAQEEIEPYESMISKINEWKDKEIKSFDRSINFFNFLLEQYYREQKELDFKFKLSTPYGKVSSRKQQDKWIYEDSVVMEDLEDKGYEQFIRVKKEVDKTEFKKLVHVLSDVVSLNGEVVEGIEYNKEIKMFINKETGEIEDKEIYEYHGQAIVYNSKIIEGVKVIEQPDSITVKVVE